ncbi:AraC family transcriptional regulator [bacterium]|jgi:predicted transcriptional regulator YdeE|nr:AraC family transcriptional regulator [bacterium]
MTKKTNEAFSIIGISVRTTTDSKKNFQDLMKLWTDFKSKNIVDIIPNKKNKNIVCVYDNYKKTDTGTYEVRATVGCIVTTTTDIPISLNKAHVPKAIYQKYNVSGDMPSAIVKKWEDLWKDNELLNRTFDTDYEFYGEKSFASENPEMDIYIGVKN